MGCFRSLEDEKLVLCDACGPAEITFSCNSRVVSYNSAIPKHEGLATWPNYVIYILDQDFKPFPVNVLGEVCIAGSGLGLGFLRNRKLTYERLIPNPYASRWFSRKDGPLCTGLEIGGRLVPDGSLLWVGRIDGDT